MIPTHVPGRLLPVLLECQGPRGRYGSNCNHCSALAWNSAYAKEGVPFSNHLWTDATDGHSCICPERTLFSSLREVKHRLAATSALPLISPGFTEGDLLACDLCLRACWYSYRADNGCSHSY